MAPTNLSFENIDQQGNAEINGRSAKICTVID